MWRSRLRGRSCRPRRVVVATTTPVRSYSLFNLCARIVTVLTIDPVDVTQSSFIVGELTLGIFTANLPILSVVATRGLKKLSAWTGIRLSVFSPSRNLPSRKVQGGRQKQHNLLNQQGAPKVASDPQSSTHVSVMRPSPREYVEFGKDGMTDDVMELREVHEKSNV